MSGAKEPRGSHYTHTSALSKDSFSVVQTLGIPVIILDIQGRITHFSWSAELISGYRSNEVLRKKTMGISDF